MRSFLECVPCIMRQINEIADRFFRYDEKKKECIIEEASRILHDIDITTMTPPEATTLVHQAISKMTGIKDLYGEIKRENNELALSLYPRMEEILNGSKDRLLDAIRLSIAGNIIDYGAHSDFNVDTSIAEGLTFELAVNDYNRFKKDISAAKKVLFIGDNAGEIVFDKLLVTEIIKLSKEVVFAVKSKPILNDVLMEDARFTGMTEIVRVIESGSDLAGTMLVRTNRGFRDIYRNSDIIIAKGQGNLETLEDQKKKIYFMLKCKCEHLSKRLKCRKNDIILMNNSNKRYKEFLKRDFCVS